MMGVEVPDDFAFSTYEGFVSRKGPVSAEYITMNAENYIIPRYQALANPDDTRIQLTSRRIVRDMETKQPNMLRPDCNGEMSRDISPLALIRPPPPVHTHFCIKRPFLCKSRGGCAGVKWRPCGICQGLLTPVTLRSVRWPCLNEDGQQRRSPMNKDDSQAIIVAATLRRERRTDGCAAHLIPLGLTAYGQTMEEAERSLKDLFNRFVNEYRRLGVLGERLTNHFHVDWWPADQYDGDLEVEDTTPGIMPRPSSTSKSSETTIAFKEAA